MNGNAQIIQGIKQDHSGIGYVSAGYLKNNDSQIKALRVSPAKGKPAVSPLEEKAILENKYFFQRPLYQFIRADSWPKVRAFIEFEKSEPGKAVIKASGYYFPPKAVAHTQL